MTEAANVIHVEPDSELGRLLDQVVESDAMLEKDGVHYRVNRVETPVGTRGARRHRLEPERILEISSVSGSQPRAVTLPAKRTSILPTRSITAANERARI